MQPNVNRRAREGDRTARGALLHRRLFLALALAGLVGPAAAADTLLTIDGQPLGVETLGTAGPAVVLEAGLGNDLSTWKAVAGPISAFARVVAYDRPGLGRSLPMARGDAPVTAEEVARRLHALLAAAGIRPPCILVGHSLGGLYVQMFARTFPRDTAGVVLLDSSSTDAPAELKTRATLVPGSAAYLEEEGVAESNRQIEAAGPFPDVPLTVIAATDHGPYFRQWEPTLMRLQEGLARLSPKGTLIVAEGSGHDVQVDRPQLVVDAVRRMVEATQTPARP